MNARVELVICLAVVPSSHFYILRTIVAHTLRDVDIHNHTWCYKNTVYSIRFWQSLCPWMNISIYLYNHNHRYIILYERTCLYRHNNVHTYSCAARLRTGECAAIYYVIRHAIISQNVIWHDARKQRSFPEISTKRQEKNNIEIVGYLQ